VIRPEEVIGRLLASDKAEFSLWEQRIDADLVKYSEGELLIDCTATKRVRGQLLAAYTAAGWNVREQQGDQRDPGPWLVFSVKP
jgi:hypothetical protein